jgi:dolichol-phosphate mannosyltransferase
MNRISNDAIEKNVGDFRLMDRQALDVLIATKNPVPYLRGMVSELGFKRSFVDYERAERHLGQSKFSIISLVKLGIIGLINHSNLPARVMDFIATICILTSSLGAIYYFVARYAQTNWPMGLASIYIFLLFSIGINAIFSSILFRYVRQIHQVVTNESGAIIQERVN